MADRDKPRTGTSGEVATSPGFQSYGQINVAQMVFELQGAVGEIKNAVAALEKNLDRGLDAVEKKLDAHNKTIEWVKRILWMVMGGALVVGLIAGFIADHGITKLAALFTK